MSRTYWLISTFIIAGVVLSGCGGDGPTQPADDDTELPVAPRVTTIAQITDNEVFEANPIFSPDGNWILFESSAAGNMDIYRIPADGGDAEQLTFDPGFDSSASWFSDGSQIVFESERSGHKKLWVLILDTEGALPSQLTSGESDEGSPMWSPDGTTIVFESNREKAAGSDLWTVPAGGGDSTRLTTTGDGVYNRTADWSPDSGSVVFESNRSGSSALYIQPLLGGAISQVTEDAGYEGHPAWSPDGTIIAYETTVSGESEIYAISAEGGETLRLTTQGGFWPRFSRDGLQIVFCVFDGSVSNIWVMSSDF
ncbi:MAG: DPP IV N-terminal domain-containing protein [Gemmatimonadales bacterium]|nr:DPP IV N-terminal domain-containing protein [Gemmatimonadales bacterium]